MEKRDFYQEFLEAQSDEKARLAELENLENKQTKSEKAKKEHKKLGCSVIAWIVAGAIALSGGIYHLCKGHLSLDKDSPYTSQSINLNEVTEQDIQSLTAELKEDLGVAANGLTDEELYNYIKALNDDEPELSSMELEEISRELNNLGLAESINGYYGVTDNQHVDNIYFSDYIINSDVQAFYEVYDEYRANLMDAMENSDKETAREASKELYDFIVKAFIEKQSIVTDNGIFTVDSISEDFTAVDLYKKIQSDLAMIECIAVEHPEDYVTYLNTIDGKVPVSYEENKETIVENALVVGTNYSNCRETQLVLK